MGPRFVVEPHVFGWWRIVDTYRPDRPIVRAVRDRMVAERVAERLDQAVMAAVVAGVTHELRRAA